MSGARGLLRAVRAGGALAATVMLAACASTAHRIQPLPPQPVPPPPGAAQIARIPDAVPRPEPRSVHGNPPFYDALGHRYFVLGTADGYLERGVASWYGPTFQGGNTSSGEPYDMYGMTAAHKTLPLPTYARVTNLANGRSVVVRINDRGPFVANRIIDLSYTAAAKLDMLREGTAMVEVRALEPGAAGSAVPAVAPPAAAPEAAPATQPATAPPPVPAAGTAEPPAAPALPPLYVQTGAFGDPANAGRQLARLHAAGLASAFILPPPQGKPPLYRVRIGPVGSVAEFDALAARLAGLGIPDPRLVTD
ncbi:MAG TPA: septal ring lytic transglycosylase RlpA family protein [Steroidobacteraceae bacterium]|nr:septal ring lytic transglycosylase RlpA family protein [Steroidobacteraceae bacterium]